MHRLLLTTCCAVLLSIQDAEGMVIGESLSRLRPRKQLGLTRRIKPKRAVNRFRLRRTNSSDLDAICNMLAAESADSNHFMHRLRVKAAFHEQLSNRLQAIDVGRSTYCEFKQLQRDCSTLAKYNVNDLLLVNSDFKTIIKKAVSTASESNAWEEYIFDPITNDSSLLHHVMVSIEDCTGTVVGFCEIGYLQQMQEASDEERMIISEDSLEISPAIESEEMANYAPTILNLIVSPSHRRLGLASRLVNFAQKYTKSQLGQYDSNVKLGLYVHPDNHSAVNLYSRKGFQKVTKSEDGLLYMTT